MSRRFTFASFRGDVKLSFPGNSLILNFLVNFVTWSGEEGSFLVPMVRGRMKIACRHGQVKNEDCLSPWLSEECKLPSPFCILKMVCMQQQVMSLLNSILHYRYIMHNTGLTHARNHHTNRVRGVNEYSLCWVTLGIQLTQLIKAKIDIVSDWFCHSKC